MKCRTPSDAKNQPNWEPENNLLFQVLPEAMLFKLSDLIVECGRRYIMNFPCQKPILNPSFPRFSRKTSSKSPLMYQYYETQVLTNSNFKGHFVSQYLGAAHGLTGILQMLLSVPGYFQVIYLTSFIFSFSNTCSKTLVFDQSSPNG